MSRSKEWRTLDRLSASRMFLERHEALSALSDSITMRFKLKRMGLDREDTDGVADLLALIDALGYQKMLANETVATRFSAVKRDIQKKYPSIILTYLVTYLLTDLVYLNSDIHILHYVCLHHVRQASGDNLPKCKAKMKRCIVKSRANLQVLLMVVLNVVM